MTLPGLALFYGGLVRARNILSVLMHCMAIACLASLVWLICGYSLAFAGGSAQLGVQVLGVVTVSIWSGIASFVIIKIAQATVGLRVSEEDEVEGLDFTAHGETGYNL